MFSDATLNQGKIGGPVALGDDRLVVVKVMSHSKAAVKPLDVVRDDIVALLKQERGVAAAKAAAEGALAKARPLARNSKTLAKALERQRRTRALREPRRSVHSRRAAHRDFRSAASRRKSR